jgi:hypothetical protein
MARRLITRFGVAVSVAAVVLSLSASAAFAGEITGNGKILKQADGTLHGQSECAFSGQEDLQFLDEEGNPLPEPTKGDPGHAQSWGQIPKEGRDFLTSLGFNPGIACNPTKSGGGGE